MMARQYQHLFQGTTRFSPLTRVRLERSLGRALFGRRSSREALRRAVHHATRELQAEGLGMAATLAVLGGMVEDGGRACRADRTSLITGEPFWLSVRAFVLESVKQELFAQAHPVVQR